MNKTQALNLLVEQALRGDLVFSASVSTSLRVQEAINVEDCRPTALAKLFSTNRYWQQKSWRLPIVPYKRSTGEIGKCAFGDCTTRVQDATSTSSPLW